MTYEQFKSLEVGDYVVHGFDHVGRILELDDTGYVVRDPGFAPGDKSHWDVSFAWNEGSPLPDYKGKEIPMSLSNPIRKAYKKWGVPRKHRLL